MKKILGILFLISYFEMNINTMEDIKVIKNDEGKLNRIDINLTLKDNDRELIIRPKVFESLRQFKRIDKYDYIEVNIICKNDTNFNYTYVKSSLKFDTDDFIIDRNNYQFTKLKGFDGKRINKLFATKKDDSEENIKRDYNYFYQNILKISLNEINFFSIDKLNDKNIKNIRLVKKTEQKLFKIIIKIDSNKYKNKYENYNYYGKMEFKLKRDL